MTPLLNALLVAGLIFPVISLLSGIGSLVCYWCRKKHSSAIFVPLIGPVLLTSWVIFAQKPLWIIAVVWTADIGTLAFLSVIPQLFRDWWHTSPLTRILTLRGEKDNQSALLTLHSTGHYLVKKAWSRPPGQTGIVGLGEPGTFTQLDDRYELTSHHGLRRVLQKMDESGYFVQEEELPKEDLRDYSLSGWVLRA